MSATTTIRSPVTTNTINNKFLDRTYAASTPKEQRAIYDEWAAQYDDDVVKGQGYVAPGIAVEKLLEQLNVKSFELTTKILDAGCGTGLVGAYLARAGAKSVDGMDVSSGMLAVAAKTQAYQSLVPADLTQRVDVADDHYDAVVCVGTFTHGHVGPEALGEFVRIVKPKGPIVATVLEDIWESDGFRAEVERLEKVGAVEVKSRELDLYRSSAGVKAYMVVLRVV